MPLFQRDEKSLLYVHVPKTGGTAIEAFFQRNGFAADLLDTGGPGSFNRVRRCPPQHMEARLLEQVLRPGRCDYVFMTVRDPLARIVSEYRMRARGTPKIPKLPVWFDRAVARLADDPYAFENHLRPQAEFRLKDAEVFRQEDGLDRIVDKLEQVLGATFEQRRMPRAKPHEDVAVPQEDIDAIRTLVRGVYWRDYAVFGY